MLLYCWMIMQVIAESLPISSSGHVQFLYTILEQWNWSCWYEYEKLAAFDESLQAISAGVIVLYFFSAWWRLIIKGPIRFSSLLKYDVWIKTVFQVVLFGFVVDAITFLFWNFNLGSRFYFSLMDGFLITAIVLWSLKYTKEKKSVVYWSLPHAVLLGLVQGLALLPGISRFASTLATLQWLGYKPQHAFAISFLVQWPLIVAGSIKGFLSLHDQSVLQTMQTPLFICMILLSACIAYILLSVVEKLINKNLLWKFSYYMIIPITISLLI